VKRTTAIAPLLGAALLLGVFAANASGAPVKHAAAPHAKRTTTAAAKGQALPKRLEPPPGMPRTLSDVHIEGEIPVPQVLFITARDQRRFMDFQHHRYLRSSAQLGEATPFPTWVAVTQGSPVDSRKETSR
jgi:hypothetical protein